MSLKYTAFIVNLILLFGLTILIAIKYQKIKQNIQKGIMVSLMMILVSIAFVNVFEDYFKGFRALSINTQFFIFGFTVFIFILLGWIIVLTIKNDEIKRIIFFSISLTVLIFQIIITTENIINGNGSFQAHLCRQMAYLLPVVYYSKYLRKYLLPYFVYGSLFGAYITLSVNLVIYTGIGFHNADSIATHMALGLSCAIMLKTKEIIPNFWHVLQYTIGLALSTLLAHYANLIVLRNTGAYGDNMYMKKMLIANFIPTPLVGFLSIIFVVLIILGNILITKCRRKKEIIVK